MSSRQNPHVSSCYCYCYRFLGDTIAFQGLLEISIFEIKIHSETGSEMDRGVALLVSGASATLHVPFICMHIPFILHSVPLIFLSFSFHVPFICISIFLSYSFIFLSYSFQCAFMSFHLPFLFLSICMFCLFILHSCPCISCPNLGKWL